jgi:hypothetical protein
MGGGRKGFSLVSEDLYLAAIVKWISATKNDIDCVYQVLMVVLDCNLDGSCLENRKRWCRLRLDR